MLLGTVNFKNTIDKILNKDYSHDILNKYKINSDRYL